MEKTSMMASLAVLAVLSAAQPSSAFLHDLLLQPLQQIQHAVQPHPQYNPYQYRRAASDNPPLPAAVQPVQQGVYANSRPVLYQWQPSSAPPSYSPSSPSSYGSAYSYSSNPFATLLQNPWFSWPANRQPQQQQQLQQPQQAQLLSAPVAASAPQQLQQPLQAFWALLPWNSNSNNFAGAQQQHQQQQQQSGTPVWSFLQNQAALLPWAQQSNRPGVVYTTPLAPSSAPLVAAPATPAVPHLQVVAEAAAAPAPAAAPALYAAAAPSLSAAKPQDDATFQVEDSLSIPSTANLSGNGIRRIALQPVSQEGLPCA